MDSLYSDGHRALQDEFGTRKLADFLDERHVQHAIIDPNRAFIEAALWSKCTKEGRGVS